MSDIFTSEDKNHGAVLIAYSSEAAILAYSGSDFNEVKLYIDLAENAASRCSHYWTRVRAFEMLDALESAVKITCSNR